MSERRTAESLTARRLVAGGRSHRVDTVILATGFDAYTGPRLRIDVRGRGGALVGGFPAYAERCAAVAAAGYTGFVVT